MRALRATASLMRPVARGQRRWLAAGGGTGQNPSATSLDNTSNAAAFQSNLSAASSELDQRPIGVSYSGCGWLLTFHAGVTDVLQREGILDETSKYYGVSGGSIVAVASALGFSPDELMRVVNSVFDEIPRGLRIWGAVDGILQDKFGHYFPDDAHEICSGRVGVSVFQVWPSPKPLLVTEFDSKEDLISTVIASCYIPGYIDGQAVRRYRGGLALDGGLGSMFPRVDGAIPVFPFPPPPLVSVKFRGIDGIGPSLLSEYPFTVTELLRGAFVPFDEENHRKLFACGQRCAEAWLERRNQQGHPPSA